MGKLLSPSNVFTAHSKIISALFPEHGRNVYNLGRSGIV